ncbi:hypothetical protein ACFB49_25170 [Sphingomonas sp. DBB INV C78]
MDGTQQRVPIGIRTQSKSMPPKLPMTDFVINNLGYLGIAQAFLKIDKQLELEVACGRPRAHAALPPGRRSRKIL